MKEMLRKLWNQLMNERRNLLDENDMWLNEANKSNDYDFKMNLLKRIESNLNKIEGIKFAQKIIDEEMDRL